AFNSFSLLWPFLLVYIHHQDPSLAFQMDSQLIGLFIQVSAVRLCLNGETRKCSQMLSTCYSENWPFHVVIEERTQ
ncbi:hypothetical protein SK128_025784, partial [Halocaridina rubra]